MWHKSDTTWDTKISHCDLPNHRKLFLLKKMWHECEKSDSEVSHLGPGQTSIMEVYFENSWQLFSKRAPS